MNKQERRQYDRDWYNKNKDKAKAWKDSRRKEMSSWFKEFKSTLCCSVCGESHPSTLDFHHTRDKKHTITDMVRKGFSIENIQKEMDKCIVVCANCHRKIHYPNVG